MTVRLRSHKHEYEYKYSLGFCLWPVEASLVRVERSRSFVQAHNASRPYWKFAVKSNRGNTLPLKQQYSSTKLLFIYKSHIVNDKQFYDDVSSDVKYTPQLL